MLELHNAASDLVLTASSMYVKGLFWMIKIIVSTHPSEQKSWKQKQTFCFSCFKLGLIKVSGAVTKLLSVLNHECPFMLLLER